LVVSSLIRLILYSTPSASLTGWAWLRYGVISLLDFLVALARWLAYQSYYFLETLVIVSKALATELVFLVTFPLIWSYQKVVSGAAALRSVKVLERVKGLGCSVSSVVRNLFSFSWFVLKSCFVHLVVNPLLFIRDCVSCVFGKVIVMIRQTLNG
jgi:hypothetical protein